jgi:adenylyl-sulfate kinase
VVPALKERGTQAILLDGDRLRTGINAGLGFTAEDRRENLRRVAEIAKLFREEGFVVIVSVISPLASLREMAREIIGSEHFLEVFIDSPLEVCEARDVKGLYKKARAGLIPDFTGISAPFEAPTAPDLRLPTAELSESAAEAMFMEFVLGKIN